MSTTIRPELSEKNEYYLSKHRYYELKHFCLQYPEWKKKYVNYTGYRNTDRSVSYSKSGYGDPTAQTAIERLLYFRKMEMVEQAAMAADPELAQYILKAVTEGFGYPYLKARLNIPCCKSTYYTSYRKFFVLLDGSRDNQLLL